MRSDIEILEMAEEVTPTVERLSKSDFTHGSPRRVLTTVKALYNSGDIDAEAVQASERWYRDYVFASTGYFESLASSEPSNGLSNDQITMGLVRASAGARITDVKKELKFCGHIRLHMMLVDELSFAAMGRKLFPDLGHDAARYKVSGQCSLILTQLSEFYAARQKKRLANA